MARDRAVAFTGPQKIEIGDKDIPNSWIPTA